MNKKVIEYCKNKINDVLNKGIIKESKFSWFCFTFYVIKPVKIEQGTLRLIINYKCLNKAFQQIRLLLLNKMIFWDVFTQPNSFQNLT